MKTPKKVVKKKAQPKKVKKISVSQRKAVEAYSKKRAIAMDILAEISRNEIRGIQASAKRILAKA